MKLYRVEFGVTDKRGEERVLRTWTGSHRDAKIRQKALMEEDAYDIEIIETDVPTDKEGLIEWLNMISGEVLS